MGRGGVAARLGLIARIGAVGGCCVVLAQCGQSPSGRLDPKYGVSASPRLVALGEPVPKGGGTYRVGKPYVIGGRTYEPQENASYSAEGLASWYGEDFHGRADRQRRSLRHDVDLGRASDAADPELRARHQPRQPEIHHRAGQRPRALSRQPRDRCFGAHRQAARLPRQRRDAGAGRLCRPRCTRRLRRHQARGHACGAARRRPGPRRSESPRRGRSCRNRLRRCAAPCRCRPTGRSSSGTTSRRRASPSASRRNEFAAVSRQPIPDCRLGSHRKRLAVRRPAATKDESGAAALRPVSRRPAACRRHRTAPRRYRPLPGPRPRNGAVVSGRGLY